VNEGMKDVRGLPPPIQNINQRFSQYFCFERLSYNRGEKEGSKLASCESLVTVVHLGGASRSRWKTCDVGIIFT
jgi:hypothetical protein